MTVKQLLGTLPVLLIIHHEKEKQLKMTQKQKKKCVEVNLCLSDRTKHTAVTDDIKHQEQKITSPAQASLS